MLGPVFNWELVRSGRRRWHWVLRVAYVGLMLLFLYGTFGDTTQFQQAGLQNHRVLAEIGARFYRAFSVYQLLAVLILAPVYAVTSISEEKIRRTLPYLLATRLRDSEIVLAKIALAVLRVWEIVLCGLPLCAISLLLGGVTPELMALDFLVAMSAAWASCALGVLAAILSRRLSEGLLVVLLVQAAWFLLPVFDKIGRIVWSAWRVPGILVDMNAFVAVSQGQIVAAAGRRDAYAISLIAMSACGLVWSGIAWCILRPAWRREEQGGTAGTLFRGSRRPRAARQVWDRPWLWRELRSRPGTSIDRVIWTLYVVGSLGVFLSIAAYWDQTLVALAQISPSGMGAPPSSLIIAVYAQVIFLALLMLPYLTIAGATALAEERDGGHLDLLCITLLDQRDLVHAKLARLAVVGLCLLALPLALEAVLVGMGWANAWAVLLTVLHCLAATAFWLMFGLVLSLRVEKTSRALLYALAAVAISIVSGPMLMACFSNKDEGVLVGMSSTPFHCALLQMMENHIQPERPGIVGTEALRAMSLCYTLAHVIGTAFLYALAQLPAASWKSAPAIWPAARAPRWSETQPPRACAIALPLPQPETVAAENLVAEIVASPTASD